MLYKNFNASFRRNKETYIQWILCSNFKSIILNRCPDYRCNSGPVWRNTIYGVPNKSTRETSCTPCSQDGSSHTCWWQNKISCTHSSYSEILAKLHVSFPQSETSCTFYLRDKLCIPLVVSSKFLYFFFLEWNFTYPFLSKKFVLLVSETNFTHPRSSCTLSFNSEISCTIGIRGKLQVPSFSGWNLVYPLVLEWSSWWAPLVLQ